MQNALRKYCQAIGVSSVIGLTACGGGGVQFPADNSAAQNQATASAAIAKAAPVLDGISQAFAQGGVLPDSNEQAKLPAPSSYADGALQSVEVANGGAVVVSIKRAEPAAQAARAAAEDELPQHPPVSVNGVSRLIWIAYPLGAGIIRWYCFGDYEDVEADTKGACKYPRGPLAPNGVTYRPALGMTWGTFAGGLQLNATQITPDPKTTGMVSVSCNVTTPPTRVDRGGAPNMCDPGNGDWHVLRRLPVLCRKPGTEPAPSLPVAGWIGGNVAVTKPVYGLQLIGRAAADNFCKQELGAGWVMASHHDNAAGWIFTALGDTPADTRFWVLIRDTRANTWCGLGTGFDCVGS